MSLVISCWVGYLNTHGPSQAGWYTSYQRVHWVIHYPSCASSVMHIKLCDTDYDGQIEPTLSLCSGGAWFQLSGYLNLTLNRFPMLIQEVSLHNIRLVCGVLCMQLGLLGPGPPAPTANINLQQYIMLEIGSTRSHPVENSLWKRLRTCRKTDYRMNEYYAF
jgi:hypothetical protein